MVQTAIRLPDDMSQYLDIMSKNTRTKKSDIIRKALDSYLEDYFADKYLIPRVYEEWARDDYKVYPIDNLLKEMKNELDN